MDVTFITSNSVKAEQLSWHINYPIKHKKLAILELQSLNLDEVVEHKARAAYELIKSPVLVEDFSLVLHALGKLPGPLIKWFWEEMGTDGVCKLINNSSDRSATATVAFGLYDGKDFRLYKGEAVGTIASLPRGEELFGSDAIFIPEGYKQTSSEMSQDDQLATSIRRKALKQLEVHLHQLEAVRL